MIFDTADLYVERLMSFILIYKIQYTMNKVTL